MPALSLCLRQVYGAVTLNNSLVLGLFLLVVYLQKLEWIYSSEVRCFLTLCSGSALVASSCATFQQKLSSQQPAGCRPRQQPKQWEAARRGLLPFIN